MIALLLLGCSTQIETHCEVVEQEISDDDRLDFGFSVNEVLLRFDPQRVDARDLPGNTLPIEVSLARGEGTATLRDAIQVDEVVQPGGRSQSRTWVGLDNCFDKLAVPVVLTLDGEGVSVAAAATLENEPGEFEPSRFYASGSLDPEADSVPLGLHGAAVSGEVSVAWFEGRLTHLEVTTTTVDGARETVLWFGESAF